MVAFQSASRSGRAIAAVALLALAGAAQEPAPPAPPAQTAPPAAEPTAAEPVDAEALRAQRMAEDRARYEALVAAVDRFGHIDEARARIEKLLGTAKDRWVKVSDGYLTDVGCQNWLSWNVLRDGHYTFPESDPEGHPFDVIVDVNRQLREHGIDFLLVSFPTRGQIYPELYLDLPSQDGFAGFCPGMARFALALMDAGVEVQYLAPEFVAARHPEDPKRGDLYLDFNQHWAPRAAELTAKLVSERIRRFPWYQEGASDPKSPYLGKSKQDETWILRTDERDVPIAQGGSPPDAKPERFLMTRVLHPELRKLTFDLPSSPVALLTGSFGDYHNVNYCDFTSQLFRFLETPINKINPKGGIEDACRYAFAAESAKFKAKKKLVIWMLPESVFRTGAMWQKLDLFPDDSAELSSPKEDRRRARKEQRERKNAEKDEGNGDAKPEGGGATGTNGGAKDGEPKDGEPKDDEAKDDEAKRGDAGGGTAFSVSFAAAMTALVQESAPAAEPAPPAAEPSALAGPSPEAVRAKRAERLAAERKALEAELAAIEAFGHEAEFRDALRQLARSGEQQSVGKERWARVENGWLPMMAVDHWLEWHQPRAESNVPLAIDFAVPNHPLEPIVDFASQLNGRDVECLFVVFPSRIQLYPELLVPDLQVPADGFRGMVGATTRFLLALNERGVETIHLATPFAAERRVAVEEGANAELYLSNNKHWTPRGAEIAGRVVAERIRAMPWFDQGPIREGEQFVVERRVSAFTSGAGGQSPDKTPEKLAMNRVFFETAQVSPKDERRSPIVVMSDSFAKFYSEDGDASSFADHLRRFTGWPIDAITPMGGAEQQGRAELMRRGDDLRGKRVVVWLLHEDNLRPRPAWRTLPVFSKH